MSRFEAETLEAPHPPDPEEKAATFKHIPTAHPELGVGHCEQVIEAMAHQAVKNRMLLGAAYARIDELEMRVESKTQLLKLAHEERDLLKQTSEAAIGHLTKIVGPVKPGVSVEVVACAAAGIHHELKTKRAQRRKR